MAHLFSTAAILDQAMSGCNSLNTPNDDENDDNGNDQEESTSSAATKVYHYPRFYFRRRSISLTSEKDLHEMASRIARKDSVPQPPVKRRVAVRNRTSTASATASERDRDATPIAVNRRGMSSLQHTSSTLRRNSTTNQRTSNPAKIGNIQIADFDEITDQINEVVKHLEVKINRNDSGYGTDVGGAKSGITNRGGAQQQPQPEVKIKHSTSDGTNWRSIPIKKCPPSPRPQRSRTLEYGVNLSDQASEESNKPGVKHKLSVGSIFRREKTFVASDASSSGPCKSRTSKKIDNKGSSKGQSRQSIMLSPTTSESKRNQFVQTRSKTSFSLFGGRRRSIAFTEDDYEAAIRSAKSHLDLTSDANSAGTSKTASSSTTSSSRQSSTTSAAKKIFDRPWIDFEKLWLSKAKDPAPDIENLISTTSRTQNVVSGASSRRSVASTRPTSEYSHSLGYWPPPTSITPPPVSSTPEALRKVFNLMSPAVLEHHRSLAQAEKNTKEHFASLLDQW